MYKKAGTLILIGVIIFVFSAMIVGLNYQGIKKHFEKINDEMQETHLSYDAKDITDLTIDTQNDKIRFVITEEDKVEITYHQTKTKEYEMVANQQELVIQKKEKFFFIHFDFESFFDQFVTEIKIPKNYIQNLTINNKNAEVFLENCELEKLTITTSNAQVSLNHITVNQTLDITSSNGKIEVMNSSAKEDMKIKTSNASIIVEDSVCDQLSLHSSNGKIMADDCTVANLVYIKTSNAKIEARNLNAQKYDLTSSNGAIELKLEEQEEQYNYDLKTSNGTIKIDHHNYHTKQYDKVNKEAQKEVKLKTSNANIEIEF